MEEVPAMQNFLNYGKQWLDDDDIQAVIDVLKSDFLTQGPAVAAFEKKLADYVGAKYAVAVANGTAALHLAVKALGIPEGMEGITSPNTFSASANCLIYNNLVPKFADIDQKTYCIDAAEIKQKVSPKTALMIPVHFAGQSCDMAAIKEIAQSRTGKGESGSPAQNIYIIEDACHAIGSRHADGSMVGSCAYSDMAVFSFHPVKTIATGEGGVITTNNKDLYEKLAMLRTHGITKDPDKIKFPEKSGPWYYEMQDLGFNYRMTDMQAALGNSQMNKIDAFAERRREIVKTYNNAFQSIPWLTIPHERDHLYSAFHLYVLQIHFPKIRKTRAQVMQELRDKGIGTQVHYIPVHLQPYYREQYNLKEGDFPKTESYYAQCLSIPLFPKMTNDDVLRVIQSIKELKDN